MFDVPASRTEPRWLPPTHVIAALTIGGVLFATTLGKGVRDPDYFWHLAAGRYIAETGGVPSTDPFSFTWMGQPWTPHEWLAELIIYGLVSAVGEIGALAVFALVPGATLLVLATMLARLGVRTLAQLPVLILAALVIAPYSTLRPQVLSWLLLAVTLSLLQSVSAEKRRRLLWMFPLFVFWANLHGLYFVGIGVVGAYALFTLLGRTPLSPYRWWAVAAVALAFAGAMVTPAGPLGVLYPLRYSQEWGLAHIQEWQSPDFHEAAHWPLLVLVIGLMLNGGRATPGWLQTVAYVGVVMALVALRNSPVAAVLAAPTLALGLEHRMRARWGERRRATGVAATRRRVLEGATALLVVAASWVIFLPPGITVPLEEQQRRAGFPVAAADLLVSEHPDAHVVGAYGWGGYLIHRLFEGGGRVFIDGRNDMYAEDLLDGYTAIESGDEGWEDIVDVHGADALLFPPSSAITKGIAESAGWCEAHRDEDSVLLLRECP